MRRFALACSVALIAGFALAVGPARATPSTFSFTPTADSYTTSVSPSANNGTSTALGTADNHSYTLITYVKFSIAGLVDPVTSAHLHFTRASASSDGDAVSQVPDTSWSETAITWANQPAMGGSPIIGQPADFDITSFVTGNGTYSFAMFSTSNVLQTFYSREDATRRPRLDITTDSPTTTTTTTTTSSTTTTTVPPTTTTTTVPPSGCTFQTTANPAAFCETFDAPHPTAGTRSGDLDGVLWGVSRARSYDGATGGLFDWHDATMDRCGTNVAVTNLNDVQICNGKMVEAVNDGGTADDSQSVLAEYPRQPFDFAGRTGTLEFDVGNDTQGDHAAWPAFALTDQPVPAPYSHLPGLLDNARNSVGVSFGQACQAPGNNCDPSTNGQPGHAVTCVGVDQIYDTANYVESDLAFNYLGCVTPGSETALNHVEMTFTATGINVFMSDAGNPASLRLVASATFALPLTRGLPWMEDVHYNGNKFNTQANHSFAWDNFAFDGPFLARDHGYDILDNTARGSGYTNIGYATPHTFTFSGVDLTNAASALLELTYWPESQLSLTYAVNGHAAHTVPWPFGSAATGGSGPTYVSQTLAMAVPLSELVQGTNTVVMSSSAGVDTGNYDLIIVPVRT